MEIFLMRHGHATDHANDDGTRPLSKEGEREGMRAGEFLRKVDKVPNIVLHSPFTRARLTAECVAIAAGMNGKALQQHDGLEPEDDASAFFENFLSEFTDADSKVLIVGHEPFMSTLAQLLLTRNKAWLSLKFDRGALLGAENPNPSNRKQWQLCFYLTGSFLKRLIWTPN
jgi:phosphohistidine phosphatase